MFYNGFSSWLRDLDERDSKHVYFIGMTKNSRNWFFAGLDEGPKLMQILWTPTLKHGHIFVSEEQVEDFKAEVMTPRKVSIIRMESVDILLKHN